MKKNIKIGSTITFLDSIDSTNNYTANLVNENKIENGQVIMADFQGEGRGQRGAQWHSERGMNLLVSFFLQLDNMSVKNQSLIAKYVTVSIFESLLTLGLIPKIKWPNDILIEEKKICGILIENQFSGNKIKSSIIGFGLNVNQEKFDLEKVTSLRLELGAIQERMSILGLLINNFNKNLIFLDNSSEKIEKIYFENLFKLGIKSNYFNDRLGSFEGVIIGVDPNGMLLIETEGRTFSFDVKELKFC
jgi:BirA family biotin operon repressor/biotin-[acetyl-CoA-carboxylase] ligase